MTSTSTDPWSPQNGTTFTSLSETQTLLSPSRYSYTSDSQRRSSDDDDNTSTGRMRRITVSPSLSQQNSNSSDDNSLEEVEATLTNLDDELDDTEQVLTQWSHPSSSGPSFTSPSGSYTGTGTYTGYTGSPSFVSLPTFAPRTGIASAIDPIARLSKITEKTEESRPNSGSYSGAGAARPANPTPDTFRRSTHLAAPSPSHSRSSTDPSSERDLPPPGRTTELIARFETNSPARGHSRATSAPGAQASGSYTVSQSSHILPSTTGYGSSTGYGYGSSYGYGSRPSSPTKSRTGGSSASYTETRPTTSSLLSPPPRPQTSTSGNATFRSTTPVGTHQGTGSYLSPTSYTQTLSTFSSNAYNTDTNTNTGTGTGAGTGTYTGTFTGTNSLATPTSTLRRPQTSPRSPLASVRNIVALWKERTPSAARTGGKSSVPGSATSVSPPPVGEGLFAIRRRAQRVGARLREREGGTGGGDPVTPSLRGPDPIGGRTGDNQLPPGFNVEELAPYTQSNEAPLHIGLLWYLNVHASPPYRWQRCQALLYPHMLLLSWLAPGGGRGIVALDLLNCTNVQSTFSPTHPSARDDVGTIAAKHQSGERGGQPLMDMLVPFHMLYADGVERLAAESLLERQKWVNRIWEAVNRPIALPDSSSVTRSPSITGSIRTIMSSDSRSSSSSTGSRSTVFVPPLGSLPSISDFNSNASSSYKSGVSRNPSLVSSHHTRTVDDTVISNQQYVYPGDARAIQRGNSLLRRSGSMTDLDEEFTSALDRARGARPGLGFPSLVLGGSPVTVSSGPNLGREVRMSPPPSVGRGSDRARSEVSDEAFLAGSSSGASAATSSYYSTTYTTEPRTSTGLRTDSTSFGLSSRGTDVVSSTLSYRRTESGSYLGDSAHSSGSYTATSPSPLARSGGVRRRGHTSSTRSYSSGYPTEGSEKENSTGSYTPSSGSRTIDSGTYGSGSYTASRRDTDSGSSRPSGSQTLSGSDTCSGSGTGSGTFTPGDETGYDVCPSSDLTDLTSFPTSSSEDYSSTPVLSSSSSEGSAPESENFVTASQGSSEYITARSPSLKESVISSGSSYMSFPTIPSESEYETADSGFSHYRTLSEPSAGSEYITAEIALSELEEIPSERTPTLSSIKLDSEDDKSVLNLPILPSAPPSAIPSIRSPSVFSDILDLPPLPTSAPPSVSSAARSLSVSSLPPLSPSPSALSTERSLSTPSPVALPPLPPSPVSSAQHSLSSPSTVAIPPLPSSPVLSAQRSLSSPSTVSIPPLPSSPSVLSAQRSLSSPSTVAIPPLPSSPVLSAQRSLSSAPSVALPLLPLPSPSSPTPPTSLTATEESPGAVTPTSARYSQSLPPSYESSSIPTATESVLSSTLSSTSDVTPSTFALSSSTAPSEHPSTLPPRLPSVSTPTSISVSTIGDFTPFTPTLSSRPPPSPQTWAQETDDSYESSQLEPSPSVRSLAIPEGPDTSFETSFLRPSGSAISSADRLSTIPETPTPSTSLFPPSPLAPLTPVPLLPSSVSSSSDVLTPTSMSSFSTESSVSIVRSPSGASSSSFISQSSIRSSLLDSRSLVDEPAPRPVREPSTVPSLLTTPMQSPRGPPVPAPSTRVLTPEGSIIVSLTTPHGTTLSEQPSIRTVMSSESIVTQPDLSQDIGRLAEDLHRYNEARGDETRAIADNVQALRDELLDLSAFLRRTPPPPTPALYSQPVSLQPVPSQPAPPQSASPPPASSQIASPQPASPQIASPQIASPQPASPPPASLQPDRPHVPQPIPQLVVRPEVERINRSVGGNSVVSSLARGALTVSSGQLTRATSSASSIGSFLSSHHSDDDLLASESGSYHDSPPPWHAPPIPESDDSSVFTETSSYDSGPYHDGSESPSLPPLPPPSPTPSSSPPSSSTSTVTARPLPTPPDLLGPLNAIQEQLTALWHGQTSTNHMLDELRDRRIPQPDNSELIDRLHRIEDLLQSLLSQGPPETRIITEPAPPPPPPTQLRSVIHSDDSDILTSFGSEPEMPTPVPARGRGPSLVQQLDEILSATLPSVVVEPPPPLVSFVYQPAERGTRPRSASPVSISTLPPRPETEPPPFPFWRQRERQRIRRRPLDRTAQASDEGPAQGPPVAGPTQELPVTPAPPPPDEGDIDMMRVIQDRRMAQRPETDGVYHAGPTPLPIFDDRPPTAPPDLGRPPVPTGGTWYTSARDQPSGFVPPPVLGQQQQGRQPQPRPSYLPMPPGPTVVQLPPLFDNLMEILRENRLAQLATVDQQRELMRYMRGLNEWLERDVHDRQSELRGVVARVDQLRDDIRGIRQTVHPRESDSGSPTESESSASSRPGFIPPGSHMPMPQPFPPGFVPTGHQQTPFIPPPMTPEPSFPPVIPPNIVINQPPAPVIPLHGYDMPGPMPGPMPIHRPPSAPGEQIPFIPPEPSRSNSRTPPHIPFHPPAEPTVVVMGGTPTSSSGVSSSDHRGRLSRSSRSRTHSSRGPYRTHRSSRASYSSPRSSRSPSVRIIPGQVMPPVTQDPHYVPGVAVMPPSRHSEPRSDIPQQQQPSTIIIQQPGAQSQQPQMQQPPMPGMIPTQMVPPTSMYLPSDRPHVIVQEGSSYSPSSRSPSPRSSRRPRSRRDSRSPHSGSPSHSPVIGVQAPPPVIIRTRSRGSRSPPPVGTFPPPQLQFVPSMQPTGAPQPGMIVVRSSGRSSSPRSSRSSRRHSPQLVPQLVPQMVPQPTPTAFYPPPTVPIGTTPVLMSRSRTRSSTSRSPSPRERRPTIAQPIISGDVHRRRSSSPRPVAVPIIDPSRGRYGSPSYDYSPRRRRYYSPSPSRSRSPGRRDRRHRYGDPRYGYSPSRPRSPEYSPRPRYGYSPSRRSRRSRSWTEGDRPLRGPRRSWSRSYSPERHERPSYRSSDRRHPRDPRDERERDSPYRPGPQHGYSPEHFSGRLASRPLTSPGYEDAERAPRLPSHRSRQDPSGPDHGYSPERFSGRPASRPPTSPGYEDAERTPRLPSHRSRQDRPGPEHRPSPERVSDRSVFQSPASPRYEDAERIPRVPSRPSRQDRPPTILPLHPESLHPQEPQEPERLPSRPRTSEAGRRPSEYLEPDEGEHEIRRTPEEEIPFVPTIHRQPIQRPLTEYPGTPRTERITPVPIPEGDSRWPVEPEEDDRPLAEPSQRSVEDLGRPFQAIRRPGEPGEDSQPPVEESQHPTEDIRRPFQALRRPVEPAEDDQHPVEHEEMRPLPVRPHPAQELHTVTPLPVNLADAEREREVMERLEEAEMRLQNVALAAQDAEDLREAEFRHHEEDRDRLFQESQDRRDQEARGRADGIWHDLDTRLAALNRPPLSTAEPTAEPIAEPAAEPTEPPVDQQDVGGDDVSVRASLQAASQHAHDILDTVKAEREEFAREREALNQERDRLLTEAAAERARTEEEREARIKALQDELAAVREELENEKQQRVTAEAEARERESQALLERDEAIRSQLGDITNLVQDQREACDRKKELMDARWEEKQGRRQEKDDKWRELQDIVRKIQDDVEGVKNQAEEARIERESKPGIESVIEELRRQNAEQRELLNTLSETWRADCARQHEETINSVRSTAQEQVPFNVQGYLDEFSKALATEVRMLLGEVGKLREERRALQHELGYLLCMKSKYGPGGEFDPEWKPPPGAPGGPPPPEPPGPPEPPLPPELPPQAKPGWRTIHPRTRKKKKEVAPPPPAALPVQDPRHQIQSWATWQPDPQFAPSPQPVESNLVVPEQSSPGLFGPRTPSGSMYDGR